MTETDWLESANPQAMLSFLQGRNLSTRKIRLFGCACYRLIWTELGKHKIRNAVEAAERFADEDAHAQSLYRRHRPSREADPDRDGLWQLINNRMNDVIRAIEESVRERYFRRPGFLHIEFLLEEEKARIPKLLRHIIGNPFQTFRLPNSWPLAAIELSQALYTGVDNRLILADAMEEAGHSELAEHFRQEEWHPKGCWIVDMILGKE